MSLYKKKIIKKSESKNLGKKMYINENRTDELESYLEKEFISKKREIEAELSEWREKQILDIKTEVEQIKTDAYNEGKEKAYKEVFEQVMAENERKMKQDYATKMGEASEIYIQATKILKETEEKVVTLKRQWIEDNKEQLVDILAVSLEKIVGREINISSVEMKNILDETLNQTETKNKTIWVRVHPETMKIIEQNKQQNDGIFPIPDNQLKKSDLIIETENEWVDSTIDTKIQSFKNKIKEWIDNNDIIG